MFHKTNRTPPADKGGAKSDKTTVRKEIPSVIAKDFNLLGNIISDGMIDFDGKIDGNIQCATLIVRKNGVVNGEVTADSVQVHGRIKGLVRAKHVSLFASAVVEGVIMHQTISIADGAVIDGSIKRTDKSPSDMVLLPDYQDDTSSGGNTRFLEGFKLIASPGNN